MRRWLLVLAFILPLSRALPDSVDDTLRTHLAAIGGKDRVEAVSTMKATGRTLTPGGQSTFTMWARRPASIRVETSYKNRTLVQVYDGKNRPYEKDSAKPEAGWHLMDFENGSRFIADSDFDDPLVNASNGRIACDDAGYQDTTDGKMMKLLMTRGSEPAFWILLDPETYLITGRIDLRKNPVGNELKIETSYDDVRLDGGILTPHHILVKEGGVTIQETWVESVTANPTVSDSSFQPADDAPPKAP